ncbi:MAG: 16S rRNA (uracil(1498)-N(3))-methyltransferase [Gemmatimonadota bacterium]|jgi:16S rRNA (uracil1498-N3)-methyltransferase|nr:MAG: 16S rRNA (uracil(1498)-N(3))-methyltransferase [Gemmatimonadota bacterium]
MDGSFLISRPTLYAPGLRAPVPEGLVLLDQTAARHLRVARVRPGDELQLTNGAGELWRARLDSLEVGQARCALLERLPVPNGSAVELAFGVAAKSRTLWLVEKAVELGVAVLQPVEFERSRSVADAARSPAFWEKARRRALAALTQCGGARMPEMERPLALGAYLSRPPDATEALRAFMDPSGDPLLDVLGESGGKTGRVRLLLGPEGGMTPCEVSACRSAGFRPASLGGRILRFETAALVAAAGASLHEQASRAAGMPDEERRKGAL